MLLKAHEVMTHDRPIPEQTVSESAYIRETGFQSPFASRMLRQHCDSHGNGWLWIASRPRAQEIWTNSGTKLAKIRGHWERTITRDTELELGKLQFMVNEVPEIAYAVKNLSRQLAGPSELGMQELKQCVRHTLGHSDEWLFPTVQDKPRKTDEVATIEVFTDADWGRRHEIDELDRRQ